VDSIKINKELRDRKKHAQVKNPRKQKEIISNKRNIPAEVKRAAFQKSDKENIRLLCKNCNLRAGIKVFGLEKMTLNNRAERFKKTQ
jgi:hypothetical protein